MSQGVQYGAPFHLQRFSPRYCNIMLFVLSFGKFLWLFVSIMCTQICVLTMHLCLIRLFALDGCVHTDKTGKHVIYIWAHINVVFNFWDPVCLMFLLVYIHWNINKTGSILWICCLLGVQQHGCTLCSFGIISLIHMFILLISNKKVIPMSSYICHSISVVMHVFVDIFVNLSVHIQTS